MRRIVTVVLICMFAFALAACTSAEAVAEPEITPPPANENSPQVEASVAPAAESPEGDAAAEDAVSSADDDSNPFIIGPGYELAQDEYPQPASFDDAALKEQLKGAVVMHDYGEAEALLNDYIAQNADDCQLQKDALQRVQKAQELVEGFTVEPDASGEFAVVSNPDLVDSCFVPHLDGEDLNVTLSYSIGDKNDFRIIRIKVGSKEGESLVYYFEEEDVEQVEKEDGNYQETATLSLNDKLEDMEKILGYSNSAMRFLGTRLHDYVFQAEDYETLGRLYELYNIDQDLQAYTK